MQPPLRRTAAAADAGVAAATLLLASLPSTKAHAR